jgi:ATP-dependent RNA helicase DeaD
VAAVPTVADLRARHLELTRASLREVLVAGGLDSFRGVVEDLAAEFDVMDVAAAAVKFIQENRDDGRAGDEEEIPVITPPAEKRSRFERPEGKGSGGRFGKGTGPGGRPGREERSSRRRAERPDWDITRLYIGAGRNAGMRPADLVGAIAGEAGLESSKIGAIQIADAFSLVEVPEPHADRIITALRHATLRGRKVPVRRDRG